jgi:glutamate-1-semialdehyde 2,1-aminomutase
MSESDAWPELAEYVKKTRASSKMFEEASKVFPRGVNSAIQFFSPYPVYVTEGSGSRLRDVDGNEYIDFCMTYGAMTAGHRNPAIAEAIIEQVRNGGTILGAPTPNALSLAKEIMRRIPAVEMLRFCNSGGEATMHAIRLARAVTKRNKIIKMEGGYHGAHDYLLVSDKPKSKASMGPEDRPTVVPDSAGTPEAVAKLTLVAQFNVVQNVERLLKENKDEVAAIITEPIQTNSGVILPQDNFLEQLRNLADDYGVLLIFDEVKTGFNATFSASYQLYGAEPDLITLGKVVGGGTPLAAFGGRGEYMREISPLGNAVHYGTYNANSLCTSAGFAALKNVFTEEAHSRMSRLCGELAKGLDNAARDAGLVASIIHQGNMGSIFFGLDELPKTFRKAFDEDKTDWSRWWLGMIARNVIPYGGAWFEEWFVSAMHNQEDIELFISTSYDVFKQISKSH